ncbi:DsbA family protein [Candidatus Uhrbacteria bacterium]|nr:DsbA family protein [Candidatus Uhrbacteria bacterium]
MSEQNDFYSGSPKTMFWFGFVTGIAVASVVGSFILIRGVAGGGSLAATRTTPPTVAPAAVPTPVAAAPSAALPPATETDWVKGDLKKAKVVLVEYSDYECPFCGRHHPTMQKIVDTYGEDVAWVYRHFPLSFHPEAQPAALAAECVGEQGGDAAFWKFTDVMFAKQTTLGTAQYEAEAAALGMDMAKFKDCVTSQKYANKINDQQADGSASGVSGTPATFVNGQMVSGAVPYAQLEQIIKAQL